MESDGRFEDAPVVSGAGERKMERRGRGVSVAK